MGNFKVVFRSDNQGADTSPGWEPGCPLLVNAVQVSRNTDTGQCYLQLKLSNISGTIVNSFKLQADVSYADGTTETVELNPLDADIQPAKMYRPEPQELTGSEIASVTTHVLQVSQPTGRWHTQQAPAPIPTGEPLALEQFAAIERKHTLIDLEKSSDDYDRAIVDGDSWWVCPCGMPNVERDACCSCGMTRDALRQLEDEAYLHTKSAERKEIEQRRERKRKQFIIAIIALAAIAVLGACLLNHFIVQPELQHQETEQQTLKENAAAVVNGTPISEQSVTDYIVDFRETNSLTSDEDWNQWMEENDYSTASMREEVINYFINQLILEKIADEQGIELAQSDIDAELEETKALFVNDEAFQEALANSNMTEEKYIEDVIKPTLLQEKLAEAVLGNVNEEDRAEALSTWLEDYRSNLEIIINPTPEQLPYATENSK